MRDVCVSSAVSGSTVADPGSGSKVLVGKRRASKFGERSEAPRKRVKMRDLESVLRTEATNTHCRSFLRKKESIDSRENEISRVTEEPMSTVKKMVSPRVDHASGPLDLNSEDCTRNKMTSVDLPPSSVDIDRPSSLRMQKMVDDISIVASRDTELDLNAEDASSLVNQNPFHPYKNLDNLKSGDASECGSTSGPMDLEEKDPLQVWEEMKRKGFLSSSHGGIPVPKQRVRKSKNDLIKKNRDLAEKEQADGGFVKISAPSGLLKELNPGIINHVRNSKQVHSIIGALLRSEEHENARVKGKQESRPQSNHRMEDDVLALKLSSSTDMVPETICSLSSNKSANVSSVPSLSVKAATVASQWLELLHQDIKGRLAALRRSKKKVQAVIHTELPFQMSKEFSLSQGDDTYVVKSSVADCSHKSIADMHCAGWTSLFAQMDKALSEEEKQLESWLNQVKEMQLNCGWGLQHVPWNAPHNLQGLGIFVKDFRRSETEENSERDLVVRAAAASIYSTCNFLLSTKDVSFCL